MPLIRRIAGGSVATTVVAALLTWGGPASASGNPPVTQPDAATVTAGGRAVAVDYVGNDSDPEGDKLIMCGTQVDTPRGTLDLRREAP